MTNSTIDSETPPPVKITNPNKKKASDKPKKKKGPIRFEAIIPISLICIIAALYGRLFMDANLKSTLEWTATRIYGAEINISRIKTSIVDASFLMEGLEVTNKDNPSQNLVKIGSIKFKFLWDALLRAKFVVEDSGIFDIQVYGPRKKTGLILPKDASSNRALKKLEDGILNQGVKEFDGNALGDIAAILGGTDPASQITNIQDTLKSEKRIDEISNSIDIKEKEWKSRLDSIGKTNKLSNIKKEVKNINIKKNPLKALKQYKKAIDDVKKTVKEYTDASNAVQRDIKEFKNNFSEIEKLAKEDVAALKGRFKIPEINVTDFSKNLFGNMFKEKVASFKKYSSVVKEYMPPSKTEKAKINSQAVQKGPKGAVVQSTSTGQDESENPEPSTALVPHKRGKGTNYKFPITTGYPLFWLKRAGISSKNDGSAFSGDLYGEITNFSTDPLIVKSTTNINFQGDFKNQEIHGIDVKIVLDNLSQVAKTTFNGKIKQFPISGMKFSESDSMKFGITKAKGRSEMFGEMRGDNMIVKVNNYISKIKYNVNAKNNNINEILTNVVKGIKVINLRAAATGPSQNLNWNIQSNLGKEISKGIKGQIQAKINQAETKIKNLIDNKIGNKKKALLEKYSKVQGQLNNLLGDKRKKLANSQNQILAQFKNKQKANSPKKKVKAKAENLIKSLGEKLKLPF
jgi:uncharacterized protein (TIGR03545 family)